MMAYVAYEQTKYDLRMVRCLFSQEQITQTPRYRTLACHPMVKYQQIVLDNDLLMFELLNSISTRSWKEQVFAMIERKHPAIHFSTMMEFPSEEIVLD